jgi:hypothetical protein
MKLTTHLSLVDEVKNELRFTSIFPVLITYARILSFLCRFFNCISHKRKEEDDNKKIMMTMIMMMITTNHDL